MSWENRHKTALVLIVASLAFNIAILDDAPGIGDLSIFFSCGFVSLMSLSWIITLFKTNFGRVTFIINILVCTITITYLLNNSKTNETSLRFISMIGNIISALATIIFGTINYRKVTHNLL